VEVALLHQMFLQPRLHALAEQTAVGQDNRGPSSGPEEANNQSEEKISGLASTEVRSNAVALLELNFQIHIECAARAPQRLRIRSSRSGV
jgi:hypothetical protein